MPWAANVPRPAAAETPLSATEFGRLLKPLAGSAKALAVACSGGADSLCLALLSAEWGRKRGVAITALIVDHGLRPESGAEARQVMRWLKAAGIAAHILAWRGPKPKSNRQEAAREARYHLLEGWCARHGVRHLLLAQHRDDQAETLLLRAARGSGVDGLAAIAATNGIRIRPFLSLPKSRLIATLKARGQEWVEDPSNANPAYARSGARAAMALLGGEAATHLALTANNMARARQALEAITLERLNQSSAFEAASGIAWADAALLTAAPDEIALRALAALLKKVGGEALPPRLDSLERLLAKLRAGEAAHTLHRCRLLPWEGRLLITREARHLPAAMPLKSNQAVLWDGRFRIVTPADLPRGLALAPLGREDFPGLAAAGLPPPSWPGLPAVARGGRIIGLPSLKLGQGFGLTVASL